MPYVYAGRNDGRILISADDGATWSVGYLLPSRVDWLAAVGSALYAVVGTEIYRSTDNGVSWASVYTATGPDPVIARVVGFGGAVYALIDDWGVDFSGRIARSVNGTDWALVLSSAGVGDPTGADVAGTTLYVSFGYCDGATTPTQIWASTNGTDWSKAGEIDDVYFYGYTYFNGEHWGSGGTGQYHSADGASWTFEAAGNPRASALWDDGSNLYAPLNFNLYRSANGSTWTTPLTAGLFTNRQMLKTNAGTLLVANASGIYRSTNSGVNWTQVHDSNTYALTTPAQKPCFWMVY